jgi:NhaP-type Na+/H+ or K+/H+ antiporter
VGRTVDAMVATRRCNRSILAVWLVVLLHLTVDLAWSSADNETADATHDEGEPEEHGESDPSFAVLFPPFTLTVGFVTFYVLSRYLRALPYTAVMFLIGTLMGIASAWSDNVSHLSETLTRWVSINSELLLLTFLPGLIFKDAFGLNVHLFIYSLSQQLIFAFPLVLAGTFLGALIGFYIFPWGWPFNLAMTVGSILAATDPVAVAALLDEVGAPPRLKIHIAGESLLNDGSAIVFFSIFSERYYADLGIPGFGEEIDVRKGIALFCQKSLGAVAVGLMFGLGILGCLYLLNRRFSREENVVQVATIIGLAYLVRCTHAM